jgi:hypothetical protein
LISRRFFFSLFPIIRPISRSFDSFVVLDFITFVPFDFRCSSPENSATYSSGGFGVRLAFMTGEGRSDAEDLARRQRQAASADCGRKAYRTLVRRAEKCVPRG